MENDLLLDQLDKYSAATNLSVSTICLRALNNSRFAERYERNQNKAAQDAAKLRAFMDANPAQSGGV